MQNILVIEDNREVRENTSEILELAGYNVATAADGKEGIEAVNKNKPDLIICDIMMPELDGYGVLHLLSKKPETFSIPFIFLTAKTERTDIRKGMEMGADDYITKPFDKIELLSAVESRFRKAESIKKEYEKNLNGLTSFISDVSGNEAMQKFIANKKVKSYSKKESIYREGDFPRGMYFLVSGKIKIFKIHDFGKELITDLLKEGDFFGYTSLLEERDYAENAEALENSEITFIPREEFFSLVYNNQNVSRKFLQFLTKNISDQQDHLLKLAYSSVRKRVAEALLMYVKKYSDRETDQPIAISVSREDLANLAGIATESLIRTLSDFKEDKLIEINKGKIFILNENKLQDLKN